MRTHARMHAHTHEFEFSPCDVKKIVVYSRKNIANDHGKRENSSLTTWHIKLTKNAWSVYAGNTSEVCSSMRSAMNY